MISFIQIDPDTIRICHSTAEDAPRSTTFTAPGGRVHLVAAVRYGTIEDLNAIRSFLAPFRKGDSDNYDRKGVEVFDALNNPASLLARAWNGRRSLRAPKLKIWIGRKRPMSRGDTSSLHHRFATASPIFG